MKNYKNVALYIAIILVISIVSGVIYSLNTSVDINTYLETLTAKNNLYLVHTTIIIFIFFSTLALTNVITESVIISIEGISIGYIIGLFFKSYKMNGIFFALTSIALNKMLFILIISYLYLVGMQYTKKVLKNILGLKSDYVSTLIKPLLKKFSLIFIFSLINDTFIYFFSNKILYYLTNLL